MPVNFLIVVTGFNCMEYVRPCILSIRNQKYDSFKLVIVNDGSTDSTLFEIKKFEGYFNFEIMSFKNNHGAAFCRHAAISAFGNKNDVIVLVGLDDELLPGALEEISKQYEAGKWMTYGNWINQSGQGLPDWFQLEFDEETHKNRDYRKVKYRSTAPNTFYKFLFDKIPVDDFKLNGKWLDTTTESEVMFSCLEMCGQDRIGIIKKPIYKYNQNLPNGTQRRLGQAYKNEVYAQIINRNKKPLLKTKEGL